MRAVLQRVLHASVQVNGHERGAIDRGVVVFVGVAAGDTSVQAERLAERIARCRLFAGDDGRLRLDAATVNGAFLVVPQFTIVADTAAGHRPSFTPAASPDVAEGLYRIVVDQLRQGVCPVAEGEFGASMIVALDNDGPVTLILDEPST